MNGFSESLTESGSMVGENKCFQNRDVCVGFFLFMKTCTSLSFHPNVLKLGEAVNCDTFFHVTDHFY